MLAVAVLLFLGFFAVRGYFLGTTVQDKNVSPNIQINDGVYYEYYQFNSGIGICEQLGTENTAALQNAPSLPECEQANNVRAFELDATKVCAEEVGNLDQNTYQYDSLKSSTHNRCYFNFALAKRNKEFCQKIIANDYLIEKCTQNVEKLK